MPTTNALQKIAKTAGHPVYAHLRPLTADETALIGEAVDAGATLVPRLFREYLTGEVSTLPVQWEGTWAGTEYETVKANGSWVAMDALAARRDAFLARVRSGDLRALALRVMGQPQAVAA